MRRVILGALSLVALVSIATSKALTDVMFANAYGFTLFVVLPFVLGVVVFHLYKKRPSRKVVAAACGTTASIVILTAGCLLLFGREGMICILMALPLVLPVALFGVVATALICRKARDERDRLAQLIVLIAASLCLMGAEQFLDLTPPVYKISTSVIVDAPIEKVWEVVIDFPELPPPDEWLFQTGIAYPIRARLDGVGVGAVRYCEFSTGAFVEPITVWDAPHRLAFDVASSPPPMVEWNPFHARVEPPHLHGFLESERGEFVLETLEDGRTRVTGNTWYAHNFWPASYWRLWSDSIIHRIHARVLDHVRTTAESG